MSLALFWAALVTIAYTYVGFPALVLARGVLWRRPHRSEDSVPTVSLVIAARNEAADIGAKLDNLLALDYPADRLDIVIASDGSDDGTDAAVARYADRGVRLVSLPRVGKASALNAAVAASTGEVLVFSDANSMFATDAIRALVRPLADPEVGGVAGDQRYLDSSGAATGESSYWSFDRLLKHAESRAGNTIAATGAIYAIRRSLFEPVPDGVTDDFATSTAVIARGRRLVFAPDAVAYEPPAPSGGLEFQRKVRVMTRGLRGVVLRRQLLDPRVHGFYAVQLLSHKVLRRLMVVPLAVAAVTTPALWRRGKLYKAALVGQAVVYGAGAAGVALADRPVGRTKALALPAYFCLVNAAALRALWNLLSGTPIDRWEPQREVGVHAAAATPSQPSPESSRT